MPRTRNNGRRAGVVALFHLCSSCQLPCNLCFAIMSHSSGISVSQDLLERFAQARGGNSVRWIKAVIQEESVVYVTDHSNSGNFENDFKAVQGVLDPKEPCYILFRLEDAQNSASSNVQRWLLMTFAPDIAKVKAKMLIASTRDNAKKQ